MFSKPSAHLLIGPGPFERMGIELIVLWPSRFDLVDQRLTSWPRGAFQIMVTEGAIEQFGLIEPGGMDRGESRSPPGVVLEIFTGSCSGVAGIPILDQKDAAQVMMALSKPLQSLDVMGSIFVRGTVGFHLAAVHNQKQHYVERAMAVIFKLLLLNRTRNGSADGGPFKRLQIRHLIDANDPETFMYQLVSVSITPHNLLGALFEQRIQVRRFPVARAMRLQRHFMQDAPDGARADVRHNFINDRLTSQILATPVRNVQPFSNRFQTRQLHQLRPLQRGKSQPDALSVGLRPTVPPIHSVRSADTFATRSMGHTAFARLPSGHARHGRWLLSPVRAEPETTVRYGYGQSVQGSLYREQPTKDNAVFVLA